VTLSKNRRSLVTVHDDDTARLWDLTASDPSKASLILKESGRGYRATISPDVRWLITTGVRESQTTLFDLTAPNPLEATRFYRHSPVQLTSAPTGAGW
jgi:hypothetical protein